MWPNPNLGLSIVELLYKLRDKYRNKTHIGVLPLLCFFVSVNNFLDNWVTDYIGLLKMGN